MAGPEDIIQRIALTGQDDVISALTEIGRSGEEALAKLAESAGTLGEIFGALVIGITGVGAALGLCAEHSSKTTVEMANLAKQSGTTIQTMSAMEPALA